MAMTTPATRPVHDRPIALADQISTKVSSLVEAATPEDKERVAEIIAKAIRHADSPLCEFVTYTPAMAAIIFTSHDNFNRAWQPDWSFIYSQIMAAGDWRTNSQGYSFYGDTGDLADGKHRLVAQAFSETTLKMLTYFGAKKEDVATLDCGHSRTPADAASLAGIANAKEKSELLSAIVAYEKRAGVPNPLVMRNVTQVSKEIARLDDLLTRALEIGETSIVDVPEPLVGQKVASHVAGLLLRHEWPEDRVGARLDEVQTADFEETGDPLWRARDYIEHHRKPADVLTAPQEFGILVKALLLAEAGVSAANPRREKEIVAAAKKPPIPDYPRGRMAPGIAAE